MELTNLTPQEFMESIFRIRRESGKLIDYKLYNAHEKLLETGILGTGTGKYRIINKGRRIGMTVYLIIEMLTIAVKYPSTKQYYVATNEDQAKEMISKIRDIIRDARVLEDGTPIINEVSNKQNSLKIVIDHGNGISSEIIGYASSPSGLRGRGAINVFIDEYDWMTKTKDLQKEIYDAMKYFVATGEGQISINSTPRSYYSIFMKYFRKAQEGSIDFTPFEFPVLTSYKSLYKPFVIEDWKKYNYERYALDTDYIITDEEVNGIVQKVAYQKIVKPFWWISIRFLEKARKEDIELFKREVLGKPSRESKQYIPEELLDIISTETEVLSDEFCKMGVDVAQVNDITAITIGYIDNEGRIREVKLEETQLPFPKQWQDIIKPLLSIYNIDEILVDDTGGSGLCDIIEDDDDYFDLVTRICFANTIDVNDRRVRLNIYLSEHLKGLMQSGKYFMIKDRVAREHCARMEKIITANTIKYSGKRSGRDDHFFSKSLLAYGFKDMDSGYVSVGEITNQGVRLGYASIYG